MTEALPPIMQTRGLYLVSIGNTMEGNLRMEFHAPIGSRVKEVVVILTSDQPVTPTYSYAIRDRGTSTYTSYAGPYGDAERDEMLDMGGLP